MIYLKQVKVYKTSNYSSKSNNFVFGNFKEMNNQLSNNNSQEKLFNEFLNEETTKLKNNKNNIQER